jgi:hypothetical protein
MDLPAPEQTESPPSADLKVRSGLTVQESRQMEAGQMLIRLLADFGRKGGKRRGIAGFELCECRQIAFHIAPRRDDD